MFSHKMMLRPHNLCSALRSATQYPYLNSYYEFQLIYQVSSTISVRRHKIHNLSNGRVHSPPLFGCMNPFILYHNRIEKEESRTQLAPHWSTIIGLLENTRVFNLFI